MKTIYNFLAVLFLVQFSLAQDYQAKLDKISKSGLHQILLSPELRSASDNNIGYIRIFDANNNEIPFVGFASNRIDSNYFDFPILSKNTISNVATSFIISNERAIKLDGLILKIANTDLSKKYNISGSNDQKEWFGLVNNRVIDNLKNEGATSVDRLFSFPVNSYKYLKFDFIDKNSLAINVISAGLETSFSKSDQFIEINNYEQIITNEKKEKQTRILISFKNPQVIDKIKFDISAPNFYNRSAKILVDKTKPNKKRKENYEETVSFFNLDSKKNKEFDIPSLFSKSLIIVIDNEDNQPLTINDISFFQKQESIIADFDVDKKYLINIDNKRDYPNYDLAESGIDLSADYPQVGISDFSKIEKYKKKESEKSFWQTSSFMWVCIVLAVLILGYFSLSMIKDLSKNNDQ